MDLRLPPGAAQRRRLVVLAYVSLAALLVGAVVGSDADEPASPSSEATSAAEESDPLEELSLRQRVGQLIVLRFDGGERPTYVEKALGRGEAAGAILFADNVASEEQLRDLTRALQEAAGRSALIATDQEGGSIRSIPFAGPSASPGTVTRPEVAERLARQAGGDLSDLGVNVNLSPVADVALVDGSVVAGRAYPGDAADVARLVAAAIRGHESAGVASTAKHFPGIGAATLNTDDAAVTIRSSREELERVDLPPFSAAIETDVPLVMVGHALYPALDRESIASQSAVVMQDLLRDDLGFDGVIVTDSMEAEAVLSGSSTPAAAVTSVEAGADLLLTTSTGSYMPVFERILREAQRDDEFRSRVDESAARVLALKERMGLRPPPGAE